MLRKIWGGFKFATHWIAIGLLIFVCFNAAQFQMDYAKKYSNAYDQMIQEHEQQLIIGEMIRSQRAWQKTADTYREHFLSERTDKKRAERSLMINQYEVFAFFRVLERKHPGAIQDVLDVIGPPTVPMLPPQYDWLSKEEF